MWPGASLLISPGIILCVPWGDTRFGLIGDNASKVTGMQKAHNKWWLLTNVCSLTTWSIFLCISCPPSQLSLEQASFQRWTSPFSSLPDYPMYLWGKGHPLPLFISSGTKRRAAFRGWLDSRRERESFLILSPYTENCARCFILLTQVLLPAILSDRY